MVFKCKRLQQYERVWVHTINMRDILGSIILLFRPENYPERFHMYFQINLDKYNEFPKLFEPYTTTIKMNWHLYIINDEKLAACFRQVFKFLMTIKTIFI